MREPLWEADLDSIHLGLSSGGWGGGTWSHQPAGQWLASTSPHLNQPDLGSVPIPRLSLGVGQQVHQLRDTKSKFLSPRNVHQSWEALRGIHRNRHCPQETTGPCTGDAHARVGFVPHVLHAVLSIWPDAHPEIVISVKTSRGAVYHSGNNGNVCRNRDTNTHLGEPARRLFGSQCREHTGAREPQSPWQGFVVSPGRRCGSLLSWELYDKAGLWQNHMQLIHN